MSKKLIPIVLSVLTISVLFITVGCECQKSKSICAKKAAKNCPAKKQIIGGWYPVFFKSYNQKQVDSVIQSIKADKVKTITITYDSNKELADKIKENIQKELNFAIEVNHVELKNTDTVKFNKEQVTLTVHSK